MAVGEHKVGYEDGRHQGHRSYKPPHLRPGSSPSQEAPKLGNPLRTLLSLSEVFFQ